MGRPVGKKTLFYSGSFLLIIKIEKRTIDVRFRTIACWADTIQGEGGQKREPYVTSAPPFISLYLGTVLVRRFWFVAIGRSCLPPTDVQTRPDGPQRSSLGLVWQSGRVQRTTSARQEQNTIISLWLKKLIFFSAPPLPRDRLSRPVAMRIECETQRSRVETIV